MIADSLCFTLDRKEWSVVRMEPNGTVFASRVRNDKRQQGRPKAFQLGDLVPHLYTKRIFVGKGN